MKLARLWGALLVGLALVSGVSCATLGSGTQSSEPFANDEEFHDWFSFYYKEPHPERLTAALEFMDQHGYLDETRKETSEMPLIASVFLSKVFATHESDLESWTTSWASLDSREWYVVLVGLWLTDSDPAKRLFNAHLDKVDETHQARLAKLKSMQLKSLEPLSAEVVSARQVSLLWAAFCATGDERYVHKVIDQVHWYGDEDEDQHEIGETAMMSLGSNALQHEVVARLCIEANAKTRDPKTKVLLSALLSAVAQIARENAAGKGSGTERDAH